MKFDIARNLTGDAPLERSERADNRLDNDANGFIYPGAYARGCFAGAISDTSDVAARAKARGLKGQSKSMAITQKTFRTDCLTTVGVLYPFDILAPRTSSPC